MEAWTNSSTGVVESLPEGAPSAAPAEAEVTPAPDPATLELSGAASLAPEVAAPTPQPLMMISGVLGRASAPVLAVVEATPAPASLPAIVASHAPARQPAHTGEDPAFSDQILNWMRQGDRLADPRPIEDLSDLVEPTDPVAHELLESQKNLRSSSRAGRTGRWVSVGVIGVVMSIGLYWAAQEPSQGAERAAYAAATASRTVGAPDPATPGTDPAAPLPAPAQAATAQATTPAAAVSAHGRHRHRRGTSRSHHQRAH